MHLKTRNRPSPRRLHLLVEGDFSPPATDIPPDRPGLKVGAFVLVLLAGYLGWSGWEGHSRTKAPRQKNERVQRRRVKPARPARPRPFTLALPDTGVDSKTAGKPGDALSPEARKVLRLISVDLSSGPTTVSTFTSRLDRLRRLFAVLPPEELFTLFRTAAFGEIEDDLTEKLESAPGEACVLLEALLRRTSLLAF